MRDRQAPRGLDQVAVTGKPGLAVTALGFLIGDRTLVVGDQGGGVSTWQIVPPPGGGERRLTRIYEFAGHAGPVVSDRRVEARQGLRDRGSSGSVRVHYGTSGHTLLTLKAQEGHLHSVVFAPKADGVVLVGDQGAMGEWRLDNPHPEITLKTVFGKVWYEGYSEPAYVWQSTGGTDDFEAQVQPDPADLRHAQGHVLRAGVRGAAGAAGRRIRERVHASGRQGLRQAGGRGDGRAAQRGARIPGRVVAGADGGAGGAGIVPAAPRPAGLYPGRVLRVARRCRAGSVVASRPAPRCSC